MILPRWSIFISASAIALLLVFDIVSAQEEGAPMVSPLKSTADTCKSCHLRNYQEWEQSYHAKSVVAALTFLKKYIITQEQVKGRELNRNELMACIGCHAPVMRFAADEDFKRLAHLIKSDQKEALARLNVDCVACHALFGGGDLHAKPPEEIEKQTYYGTIKNPVKTQHNSHYAPVMEKSEFCKGCHTYATPADLKLEGDWDVVCSMTYDSWAAGPTAKGADVKHCQDCHMEKKDGKAADGDDVPQRKVSNHTFPGWHDATTLKNASEIFLAHKPGTKDGTVTLTVNIDNKAGHRIPDT
ncbi:cytochrome c family protein [bacterium]|nr:cytochrome c family protein [bacterium]MCI0603000.1 cytochrome c family protein [bacterium]